MTTVIAALDESASTLPVLETARHLAAVLGVQVEAVHVQENGSGRTAAGIAESVLAVEYPRRRCRQRVGLRGSRT